MLGLHLQHMAHPEHGSDQSNMNMVFCLLLQMWNSVFWPCMKADRCIDSSVDDVSLLARLITGMQQLLPGIPLQPGVALSGYSNGGMMIQTLLCRRPDIASRLSGVALLGTMLGTEFAASSCKQRLPKALPLVWIHGVKDPVLPYEAGKSLGVSALGAGACAVCCVQFRHIGDDQNMIHYASSRVCSTLC